MVARPFHHLAAASWDAIARALIERRPGLRVHSMFPRAVNLVTGDGELLGLVGPRAGNGPCTIVLRGIPRLGLDQAGLSDRDRAMVRGGELVIGSVMSVRLATAVTWLPDARGLRVPPKVAMERVVRGESIARAVAPIGGLTPLLAHLASLVADRVFDPPTDLDVVCRAAWPGAARLVAGWRRSDRIETRDAAERLTGLGAGLTPSGDDLLAGFLVAAARGGRPQPDLAQACVGISTGRTTDLAFARVRHAASGAIEEVQETVLSALIGPDDAYLAPAVERAARWGHTSGVDTLVGLFLGLRVALA